MFFMGFIVMRSQNLAWRVLKNAKKSFLVDNGDKRCQLPQSINVFTTPNVFQLNGHPLAAKKSVETEFNQILPSKVNF